MLCGLEGISHGGKCGCDQVLLASLNFEHLYCSSTAEHNLDPNSVEFLLPSIAVFAIVTYT